MRSIPQDDSGEIGTLYAGTLYGVQPPVQRTPQTDRGDVVCTPLKGGAYNVNAPEPCTLSVGRADNVQPTFIRQAVRPPAPTTCPADGRIHF